MQNQTHFLSSIIVSEQKNKYDIVSALAYMVEEHDAALTLSLELSVKIIPTTFLLKCINLSKCTKLCFAGKLEASDKYFSLLIKNYFMDWQIRGLKGDISSNFWVVFWNVWTQILLVSIGAHMPYFYLLVL